MSAHQINMFRRVTKLTDAEQREFDAQRIFTAAEPTATVSAARSVECASQLPAACADAGDNLMGGGASNRALTRQPGGIADIEFAPQQGDRPAHHPIHTRARLLRWLIAVALCVSGGVALGWIWKHIVTL